MEYPMSVQLLIKTQDNKEQIKMSEYLEDAECIVFSLNGDMKSFTIEERELEESGYLVELLFDCIEDLKSNKVFFDNFNGVYVETLDGELKELKVNVEITEIAELGDYDTIFYDPVALTPLNIN